MRAINLLELPLPDIFRMFGECSFRADAKECPWKDVCALSMPPGSSTVEVFGEDRRACAELVVRGFAKRGYLVYSPAWRRKVLEEYEGMTVLATCGKRVFATLAIASETRGCLPIDNIFPEAREYSHGGRIQITLLDSDRRCAHSRNALEHLYRKALSEVLARKIRHIVIAFNKRHRLWYKKVGFESLAGGEIRSNSGLNNVPTVGMVLDMRRCQDSRYACHALLNGIYVRRGLGSGCI
jgi:hypothetical protein